MCISSNLAIGILSYCLVSSCFPMYSIISAFANFWFESNSAYLTEYIFFTRSPFFRVYNIVFLLVHMCIIIEKVLKRVNAVLSIWLNHDTIEFDSNIDNIIYFYATNTTNIIGLNILRNK